ncbi:MAG: glycosyltransferase [Candidatus Binatia bacterium]
MTGRLRLIVLGMMGRCPFGGQTWLYLNWLRGLNRLGHEVWYVEDDTVWPYDPDRNTITDDCTYAVRHIASCMKRVGMSDRWAFRPAYRTGECYGITCSKLDELYRTCEALLNVVGATDLREVHMAAALRVYVECDPVIAELRLANGDEHTRITLANHNAFVTYGENFSAPDCGVPLDGVRYGTVRQPIDLDLWPMAYKPEARFFTTIGNYRQSGNDAEYNGEIYRWSKHHEWEKFLNLPQRTAQPFELAIMPDDPADCDRLKAHGWRLVSPFQMSLDIFGAYPAYFRHSRAEFTVAKDMNVRLRSGWFSERDACYLACGKPVVAQDTGFSNILPTGEGLFAFTTMDEAAAAINEINHDYHRHCMAARAIAEEYFEARKISTRLLAYLGMK